VLGHGDLKPSNLMELAAPPAADGGAALPSPSRIRFIDFELAGPSFRKSVAPSRAAAVVVVVAFSPRRGSGCEGHRFAAGRGRRRLATPRAAMPRADPTIRRSVAVTSRSFSLSVVAPNKRDRRRSLP
jgi:hypothetical protein